MCEEFPTDFDIFSGMICFLGALFMIGLYFVMRETQDK